MARTLMARLPCLTRTRNVLNFEVQVLSQTMQIIMVGKALSTDQDKHKMELYQEKVPV